MSVINTNITALIGQQNLGRSQSALQTSMERLSSGLRINSAKDDAAGQAIANRMTAQITGLMQAQRNANDGISVAQTAEGALNQVNDNLQRIRELSVQAQNATNSEEDLSSIQDEITQRLGEINRISQETSFNGVKVLASDQELNIQVGANDGEQITLNLREISASTLGLSNFDVNNASLDTSKLSADAVDETVPASLNLKEVDFDDAAGSQTPSYYVDADDPDTSYVSFATAGAVTTGTDFYALEYNATTGAFTFDSGTVVAAITGSDVSAATGGVSLGDGTTIQTSDIDADDTNAAAAASLYVNAAGTYFATYNGTDFFTATVDMSATSADYGTVSFDSDGAAAALTTTEITELSMVLDTVTDPTASVAIDTSGLDAALVGSAAEVYSHSDGGYVVKGEVDGQSVYYAATVDQASGAVTLGDKLNADPLASLDSALADVDELRSELGAIQNRMESAITNLGTTSTNLSAARSRIEDADYAVEVSNMTRAQILQQAGTSVLAQANQVPQTVLSLLR